MSPIWMRSSSVAIQMKAQYWAVLSCEAVYYAVQGECNFLVRMKSYSATI